jgi:hypothetical protein
MIQILTTIVESFQGVAQGVRKWATGTKLRWCTVPTLNLKAPKRPYAVS